MIGTTISKVCLGVQNPRSWSAFDLKHKKHRCVIFRVPFQVQCQSDLSEWLWLPSLGFLLPIWSNWRAEPLLGGSGTVWQLRCPCPKIRFRGSKPPARSSIAEHSAARGWLVLRIVNARILAEEKTLKWECNWTSMDLYWMHRERSKNANWGEPGLRCNVGEPQPRCRKLFSLKIGHGTRSSGMHLEFARLHQTRCPSGRRCVLRIWLAGQAAGTIFLPMISINRRSSKELFYLRFIYISPL